MTGEYDGNQDVAVRGSNSDIESPFERLREAVRSAGGNKAVASLSRIPLTTLQGYLAGGEMKLTNVVALAKATNVSVEWLATGEGSRQPVIVSQGETGQTAGMHIRPLGTVQIARYNARAAAGPGALLDPATIIENISFSADWVRTVLRRNPAHLALIECSGDSMEPTLRDGDVLMVDTSVTEVQSSRIYVLDVDGALLVKRIQRMLNGSYRVISDNPRYEAEVIEPSARAPLRIVGEVVWQSGLSRS
jgi:phage repressor protein C with HTH and peptisase S24 domain